MERGRKRQREDQREFPHINLPQMVMDLSFAADRSAVTRVRPATLQ
jgi:hypothetical protein